MASQWLDINAGAMFMSVLKMVLFPIFLGLVVRALFKKQVEQASQTMPLVSVISIVLILAAVVAVSKDKIVESGLLIFSVVVLHNCLGYLIGYFAAKLFKLNTADSKAVAIEVGMQNSGLGAALAAAHFNPIAAVPSALFSFWHNVSGPILAEITFRPFCILQFYLTEPQFKQYKYCPFGSLNLVNTFSCFFT